MFKRIELFYNSARKHLRNRIPAPVEFDWAPAGESGWSRFRFSTPPWLA